MIDKILSISGRPGLFRLVRRGSNNLICESLIDGHTVHAFQRDRVLSLADIAMYSVDAEVPLNTVFRLAKEQTGGKVAPVSTKDSPEAQRAWFRQVFPDFDEDRVRASDIKKFIQWFNLLIETGNDDFSEPVEEEAAEAPAAEAAAEAPAEPAQAEEKKPAKKPATKKPAAAAKPAGVPAKPAAPKASTGAKTAARKAGNTKRG